MTLDEYDFSLPYELRGCDRAQRPAVFHAALRKTAIGTAGFAMGMAVWMAGINYQSHAVSKHYRHPTEQRQEEEHNPLYLVFGAALAFASAHPTIEGGLDITNRYVGRKKLKNLRENSAP